MQSVMSHNFSKVPHANIQRSSFDRSSGYKTTIDAGKIYPFFCDEVIPGDTFNLKTHGFCRLSTPLYPVMDNMFMDVHYFFVPNRLTWDNWQRSMGEQDSPGDSTDYLTPVAKAPVGGFPSGSLADYFGIPTDVENLEVNALPFRAYTLIWEEWYRDQNLDVPWNHFNGGMSTGDGPDTEVTNNNKMAQSVPLPRAKRHDYFTSCLPWPQKGTAVDLPLGQAASINPLIPGTSGFINETTGIKDVTLTQLDTVGLTANPAILNDTIAVDWSQGIVDLSSATSVTINQLREAFQIQRMYEKDARGGTRYIELVKSHFGVTSPDARLQRPEYLGGGSTPININQVLQTAEGQNSAVGDLGAFGTASLHDNSFTKSFTEHGFVIGLVSVRADLTYQQGINKMWQRRDRLDYYWPSLAHLGEQAVRNSEIYAQGTAADDDVFGYQERYAEYRYKPSLVTGQMRSNHPQSLDVWHLSQDFASLPTLNKEFIHENPPLDRVVAVPSEPKFICDFYHKLITARPMPMYGVPGNIDRF